MHDTASERILAYLESRENEERDPWVCDDLRIAWMTVLHAGRGHPQPFVEACYRVLGCHPATLAAKLEARRHALLGSLYSAVVLSLPPKKPCQTERRTRPCLVTRAPQKKISGEMYAQTSTRAAGAD